MTDVLLLLVMLSGLLRMRLNAGGAFGFVRILDRFPKFPQTRASGPNLLMRAYLRLAAGV